MFSVLHLVGIPNAHGDFSFYCFVYLDIFWMLMCKKPYTALLNAHY